jgi:hypothetical protein
MIFRRLKALGADCVYHFPELGLVELAPLEEDPEQTPASYSVSEGAVAELQAQPRRAEAWRFRADLAEMNARARGGHGSSAARDRARVPAGVWTRSPWLATGVSWNGRSEPIQPIERYFVPDNYCRIRPDALTLRTTFCGSDGARQGCPPFRRRFAALTRAMRSRWQAIIGASGPCSLRGNDPIPR